MADEKLKTVAANQCWSGKIEFSRSGSHGSGGSFAAGRAVDSERTLKGRVLNVRGGWGLKRRAAAFGTHNPHRMSQWGIIVIRTHKIHLLQETRVMSIFASAFKGTAAMQATSAPPSCAIRLMTHSVQLWRRQGVHRRRIRRRNLPRREEIRPAFFAPALGSLGDLGRQIIRFCDSLGVNQTGDEFCTSKKWAPKASIGERFSATFSKKQV